jgi:hypothetical protein
VVASSIRGKRDEKGVGKGCKRELIDKSTHLSTQSTETHSPGEGILLLRVCFTDDVYEMRKK